MNPTADLAPPEHGRWGWLGGLVGLLLVVVATTVAVVTLVVLVDRRTGERKVAVVGDSLVAESTWPTMTALPGSPGLGPRSYQLASSAWSSGGTASSPLASMPQLVVLL